MKPCTRVASVYTVSAEDIEDTVLEACFGKQVSIKIGGKELIIPKFPEPIKSTLADREGKFKEVYILPEILQLVDAIVGDYKYHNRPSPARLSKSISLLSKEIDKAYRPQFPAPGLMGFILTGDFQLNSGEIGVDFELGTSLGRRVGISPHLLNGTFIYAIRYPNASSTSYSKRVLRLYKNSPARGVIYVPAADLINDFQGDCDGDRIGFHLTSPLEKSNKFLPILNWNRSYQISRKSLDISFGVVRAEPKDVLKGFMVRTRWVGVLTYCFWMLMYSAAHHYKSLGFESPDSVAPKVLDIFTPLIEGVMDARKEDSDFDELPRLVTNMLFGQVPFEEVLSVLPTSGEKSFTHEQINLIRDILVNCSEDGKRACVVSSIAAANDPIKLALAARFSSNSVLMLIRQIAGEDLYSSLVDSLMLKKQVPWKNQPISLSSISGKNNGED